MKKDPPEAQIFPNEVQLASALDLLRRERFGAAQAALTRLPPTPQVLWHLGVALHGQNRHGEALRVLRRARSLLITPIDRLRCTIDIAIAHNKRGAAAYAQKLLRGCQVEVRALGDEADRLKCALYLAITQARRGRFQAYLDAYETLAGPLEALGHADLIVIGLATACASLSNLHHYDEARAVIGRGLRLARAHDLVYRQALFEYYRCQIGYMSGVHAPDELAAEALERLCEQSGAGLLKTDCLTLRAQLAYVRGDLDGAIAHTERARQTYRDFGYLDGAGVCGVNLAVYCFLKGQYSAALQTLALAERDALAGHAHDTLATAQFWAGWVHATLGNLALARAKLAAALEAFTALGQQPRAFQTVALLALADAPNRPMWLARAVDLRPAQDDSGYVAKAVSWLAEGYARQGDGRRAAALFEEAARRFERVAMRIEQCACDLALCALALQTGSADHAHILNRITAVRVDVRGIAELESQAALLEAEVLQRQGQSDQALDVLAAAAALATETRSSLVDPVLAGRVAALQARNYAMGLYLAHQRQDIARAVLFVGARRQVSVRPDADDEAASADIQAELDALTRNQLRLRLAHALDGLPFGAVPGPVLRAIEFDARQMARGRPAVAIAYATADLDAVRERLSRRYGSDWTLVSIEPLQPVEDAWLLLRVTATTALLERLPATPVASHLLRLLSTGDRAWREAVYAHTRSARSIRQQIARWLQQALGGIANQLASAEASHTLVLADTAPFNSIGLGALPFTGGGALAERVRLVHAPQVWSQAQLGAYRPWS